MPDEDSDNKREEDLFAVSLISPTGHHHDEDQLEHCPHEVTNELEQLAELHILFRLKRHRVLQCFIFYHSRSTKPKGEESAHHISDRRE